MSRRYPHIPDPESFTAEHFARANETSWLMVAGLVAGLAVHVEHGDLLSGINGGVPTSEDRAAAAALGRRAIEVVLAESADDFRARLFDKLGPGGVKALARTGAFTTKADEAIEFMRVRLRDHGLGTPLELGDGVPEGGAESKIVEVANTLATSVGPEAMPAIEGLWRALVVLWDVIKLHQEEPGRVLTADEFVAIRSSVERGGGE